MSNGSPTVAAAAFDGAHTWLRDGRQYSTNLFQTIAQCKQIAASMRSIVDSKAGLGEGQKKRRKQVTFTQFLQHDVPMPLSKRSRMAGAVDLQPATTTSSRSQQMCLALHWAKPSKPAPAEASTCQDTPTDSQASQARATFAPQAGVLPQAQPQPAIAAQPATGVAVVQSQQNRADKQQQVAQMQLLVAHFLLPSARTALQQRMAAAVLVRESQKVALVKLGRLPHCDLCHHCKNRRLKQSCLYFRAVVAIGTLNQLDALTKAELKQHTSLHSKKLFAACWTLHCLLCQLTKAQAQQPQLQHQHQLQRQHQHQRQHLNQLHRKLSWQDAQGGTEHVAGMT